MINRLNLEQNYQKFSFSLYFIVIVSLLLRFLSIGANDLLVEEAYYWNYANHLAMGYLDHPPMVALLIKISTLIFGINEFGVRFPSLICWGVTAFFSFKLADRVTRGTGQYAIFLLAILPFFFLHSLVITPDQPLVACWSAALYCLYRSVVLNEPTYWYVAGFWVGIGMLSKYSIVLLGPTTLFYLFGVRSSRFWLKRKEPYLCALIAILLFLPVIYWNATHEWASFTFQGMRRFKAPIHFSFHKFIGLLFCFLTPLGVFSFLQLWKKAVLDVISIEARTIDFFRFYTLIPLVFFGLYSVMHEIRFNWSGPGLLALIPWLAVLIHSNKMLKKGWTVTSFILLVGYVCLIIGITFSLPNLFHKKFFTKFIDWGNFTKEFHAIGKRVETEFHTAPIFVPLDLYNISSELYFYQAKYLSSMAIQKTYPVEGCHIFGADSLMYKYWSSREGLGGKLLILISEERYRFTYPHVEGKVIKKSAIKTVWAHSQGRLAQIRPYYYQVVQMKIGLNASSG